jgi:uncharacterized protein (DUF58 family)
MASPQTTSPQRPDALQRAEELASTLPPLLVAAERVASTVAQGVHGRRRIGQGDAFWQYRAYQPGDTAQKIDWRQSAKTQHVFIRENEWEAAQSVWMWRDDSPSMQYASQRNLPQKGERAGLLLLALSALLMNGGERVALLGEGYPPANGRATLVRLAEILTRGDHQGGNSPARDPLPRHASTVLFSDFLGPTEEIEAAVHNFAGRGVTGHLVQVLDPAEESLPFTGRIRFEGLEAEGTTLINRTETVRDEYIHRLTTRRSELQTLCRRRGWTFSLHHTDTPPQAALLALYGLMSQPRD